jgi:hypothetical protein
VLADENGYFCDGEIYLGRQPGAPPERDQAFRVVTQLCTNHYHSGRHLTVDNFYCSVRLAETLLKNATTLLGTLRKNKTEIPQEFLSNRPHLTSLFGYTNSMQLASYMAKPSKCVLILSAFHSSSIVEDSEKRRPQCVLDYNQWKYPVDVVDQMVNCFSTRRKVRRWPMSIFSTFLI